MQRRRLYVCLLAMCVAAVISGGCNPPQKEEPVPDGPPVISHADEYPEIFLLDGVSQSLSYSPPSVLRPSNAPMKVFVPVRLRSRDSISIQYQFEFFTKGEDGTLIPDDSGQGERWRFVHLPGLAQHTLSGSAMNSGARYWRLTVRPAQ